MRAAWATLESGGMNIGKEGEREGRKERGRQRERGKKEGRE